MGNMETLGKIGTKTIKVILFYMTVIGLLMTAFGSLFYPIQWGSVGATSFSQVLDLVYDIIPSNLFEPFITGNTLQMIFVAIMVGLSMLVLSSRVNQIFELVEQLSALVRNIMTTLSSFLPVLIFLIFTGMISSGDLTTILNSWKSLVIILVLMTIYYIVNFFRIAIVRQVSPRLLWKKIMPTFMIAFSTASSAAAFTTNVQDAHKRLGIDKKLVEFATPLGQVLFMPAYLAMLLGTELSLAEACNVPITIPWLFIALVTNLLVSYAVPPIPGGAALGFAVVFAQLGIPAEMIAIAIAINAIPDFPATAIQVSGWQLTLIDVADSLNLLDKETLRKDV
jgi:Na+/H+-dicarboxylate symporter